MRIYISIIIAGLLLTSCNLIHEPTNIKNAEPIKLSEVLMKRVPQDNEFAFDLLKSTIDVSKEDNVVLSPLSMSIALGMVLNGADGDTKTQIESTLKLSGLTSPEINAYYRTMIKSLPTLDPTTKLSISNSLWYEKGFNVKPAFLDTNAYNFSAYVKALDFTQQWAVDTINNWCAKSTNNLIPTIIDKIPDQTVMYLMNAIYFKGSWRLKFDKKSTFQTYFTKDSGAKVKVNMMTMKDTFAYAVDDKAQYLEMNYGNKAYSMVVILPAEGKTTSDFLSDFNIQQWDSILDKMHITEVIVNMPRFETECSFKMNDELADMGMPVPFTDQADFSGISDEPLVITEVKHKTYIKVDEEGTEAAAVTSVAVGVTAVLHPVFNVNKPFIFVIREKSTGVILFIGKMGDVEMY